jgi:hypothetical protein
MKKKIPFLDFYNECHESNFCPFLCHYYGGNTTFRLFIPNAEELRQHVIEGHPIFAWGCDGEDSRSGEFTQLRQNIVLFCAAINNEL